MDCFLDVNQGLKMICKDRQVGSPAAHAVGIFMIEPCNHRLAISLNVLLKRDGRHMHFSGRAA
jgi:hypothetical protein